MSDQESLPAGDGEGQEPKTVEEGQEPDVETETEPQEGEAKTFDEEYVKDLRKQAATARTRATKAERQLEELRAAADTSNSDTERLTKAVDAAEARADAAELKASAYEVAADRSLDLKWAEYLTGDTREAQEQKADELVKLLAAQGNSKTPTSFDAGVRRTPEETRTPEEEHNLLLLRASGRVPER